MSTNQSNGMNGTTKAQNAGQELGLAKNETQFKALVQGYKTEATEVYQKNIENFEQVAIEKIVNVEITAKKVKEELDVIITNFKSERHEILRSIVELRQLLAAPEFLNEKTQENINKIFDLATNNIDDFVSKINNKLGKLEKDVDPATFTEAITEIKKTHENYAESAAKDIETKIKEFHEGFYYGYGIAEQIENLKKDRK